MARIQYDTEHKGRLLQRTLAGYLSHVIEDFPVDPLSIYELVVAGNSTMRDLFFRQSVYSIGQDPYQSFSEIQMATGERTTTSLTASPENWDCPFIPTHASTACPSSADMSEPTRLRVCWPSIWPTKTDWLP